MNLEVFSFDFLAFIPEVFLLLSICVLLGYGVWYEKERQAFMTSHQIALGSLCCIYTIILMAQAPISTGVFCWNALVLDPLGSFLKLGVLLATLGILSLSGAYLRQEGLHVFEYIILVLLATLSLMLMVCSNDLMALYLAIEFQSLGFYVLAALKRESEYSTEAGLKYFVLGAFSSGLFLFGCSLVYGFTGTTNFDHLGLLLAGPEGLGGLNEGVILVGIVFLSVAFLFKIAAAPFHMWSPDVYEGAPTIVTAFFSSAPKLGLMGVMLRLFCGSFFYFLFSWQQIFFVCSLVSMVLGALGAMNQQKIKRLLAFSSIGHVGFLLIGLICGSLEGIQATLLYLLVYMVMTLNVFGILLALRSSESKATHLDDLKSLSVHQPLLAMTLTANLFSMAGIPPLAGFFSKFYLFFAAVSSSLYSLAILGVLISVVSCFYYIRVVKVMYFDKGDSVQVSYDAIDRPKSIVLGLSLFFILFFCLYPSVFFVATHAVALSLV